MKRGIRRLQYYGRGFLNRISRAPANPNPIIILGNQKSGTSAISALLARATGLSLAIDLVGINEPVQTLLHTKELSFSEFVSNNGWDFSRDVVKEPALTFLYDELVRFFPGPKVVFVIRDPRENIRSILDRLCLPGDLDQLDGSWLRGMKTGWRHVLDGRWLGLDGENYIDMLAQRWNLATDVYLNHTDRIILIRYEDFVADKEGEIAQLAMRLDLDPVRDITDKVDIQYQPRGCNRGVPWLDFFGADNLTRIETICTDRMRQFGYLPIGPEDRRSGS